ncbi:MAG: hypothetical protein U0174_17285 [Polyangiaceae bacterium]
MQKALWPWMALVACGGTGSGRPMPGASEPSHAEYTVVGTSLGGVEVSGTFVRTSETLSLELLGSASNVFVEGGFERRSATQLRARACAIRCAFRYAIAEPPSLVQSSKLLLMPEGRRPQEASVRVRGNTIAALFGEGETRKLLFDKRREGAPFAFGPMRAASLERGLELVVLEPNAFVAPESFDAWVKEAYGGVTAFYGQRPVSTARVFLKPVPGRDEPLFGQALTLSGPAVTLLMGTETPPKALRADWTLVHELLHLGFPTVVGGRYLMEGLSTYFEPIVRARLGWHTAEAAWRELYRGMADVDDTPPLSERRGIDATYWGGAALLLSCDVALRRRTGRSLEGLLRQSLLRGRTSSDELPVATILEELDGPNGGAGVLTELFGRHAFRGEPFRMTKLFAELGVRPDGSQDDGAPLAGIRQSIMNAR